RAPPGGVERHRSRARAAEDLGTQPDARAAEDLGTQPDALDRARSAAQHSWVVRPSSRPIRSGREIEPPPRPLRAAPDPGTSSTLGSVDLRTGSRPHSLPLPPHPGAIAEPRWRPACELDAPEVVLALHCGHTFRMAARQAP